MNPNPERDERVKRDKKPHRVWITWDDAYPWETPETGGDEYVRVELLNDAATRMREACVEKVRERRDEWRNNPSGDWDEEYADAADAIMADLESLTLDQEQEKR